MIKTMVSGEDFLLNQSIESFNYNKQSISL